MHFAQQAIIHHFTHGVCGHAVFTFMFSGGMHAMVLGGQLQLLHYNGCHSEQHSCGGGSVQIYAIHVFILCDGIASCGSVPACVITTQDSSAFPAQRLPYCRHGDQRLSAGCGVSGQQ